MKFSKTWKSSKKPSKQRLYRYNAPLHIKNKLISCHLNKELRAKYGRRAIGLRKGDKVKVARGQFRGKTGPVDDIDTKVQKVIINGVELTKKDGSKVPFRIAISNLIIVETKIDDKKRQKIIDRKKGK